MDIGAAEAQANAAAAGKGAGKSTPGGANAALAQKCPVPSCGKTGHTEETCWTKYRHLKPVRGAAKGKAKTLAKAKARIQAAEAELAQAKQEEAAVLAIAPLPRRSGRP